MPVQLTRIENNYNQEKKIWDFRAFVKLDTNTDNIAQA